MFLENLDDFVQQAEELYLKDPLRVRYVLKYKHKDGKLFLKVTDDKVVRVRDLPDTGGQEKFVRSKAAKKAKAKRRPTRLYGTHCSACSTRRTRLRS